MTRDPGLTADGVPREITRIEFEILAGGLVRWTLFSSDPANPASPVRMHTEAGRGENLRPCLDWTAMFCGVDPDGHAEIYAAAARAEERQFPDRLDRAN